ncbi:MAG: malectin domain-containing carbohydrate-binding protein [bacterium]
MAEKFPFLFLSLFFATALGQVIGKRYYAHEVVEDRYGVIAPWYKGQDGQLAFRVRVAAETLKRYPWATPPQSVVPAPHFVFNSRWAISPEGEITIPPIDDWLNGDLGQRSAYIISSLVDYYRFSGDASAIPLIWMTADYLLDYCLTPPDHPWPRFLISVPCRGKPYGTANPKGFIQLDITAEVGIALLQAYKMIGNRRWLEIAKHWGDLLSEKADKRPGIPPWGRYANPEDVPWEDIQTGGIAFILTFLDELEKLGYSGRKPGSIREAREAGERYLKDVLLPRWTIDDTWGRNYWDWPDPVQAENVTEFVVRYMMEHPQRFPNWKVDCRNIMSLFLNRTSVSPASNGDVYHGAWAYPESSGCCGRSLWYGPMELATVYAQYGVLADDEWAREMARRQIILATYDTHETGVVEDNIDGGQIVAGDWFKIAHPMALKHCLAVMAWLPELFAPARENHIMRSSSVIRNVIYGVGDVYYETFDAPVGVNEVLRLAFKPEKVLADGKPLFQREDLACNGYVVKPLPCGDFIVEIRHDGKREIRILGNDPQKSQQIDCLPFEFKFKGNQVRIIGSVGPEGGLADIYIDGEKQLVGIDCWSPLKREKQVLYYKSGLPEGEHLIKIVPLGKGNPRSKGSIIKLEAIQWSDEKGECGFGEGGGPRYPQRVIFGYPKREDYVDSKGNGWRPATEFVVRLGHLADVVKLCWWTEPRAYTILNTSDPEIYRYGVHAHDLTAYFTVGPGSYYVVLKFAETRDLPDAQRAMTIEINGKEMVRGFDVLSTAGGKRRAVDLIFNDIQAKNGIIAVRLRGTYGGEAMIQAIEIGPGKMEGGAKPVCIRAGEETGINLLQNPGFEETSGGSYGRLGDKAKNAGWNYLFLSPSQSYIWEEADYIHHPDWGLPEIHSGKQALRTHSDGDGHTGYISRCARSPWGNL